MRKDGFKKGDIVVYHMTMAKRCIQHGHKGVGVCHNEYSADDPSRCRWSLMVLKDIPPQGVPAVQFSSDMQYRIVFLPEMSGPFANESDALKLLTMLEL